MNNTLRHARYIFNEELSALLNKWHGDQLAAAYDTNSGYEIINHRNETIAGVTYRGVSINLAIDYTTMTHQVDGHPAGEERKTPKMRAREVARELLISAVRCTNPTVPLGTKLGAKVLEETYREQIFEEFDYHRRIRWIMGISNHRQGYKDKPFVGDPLLETLEELADAVNYIEEEWIATTDNNDKDNEFWLGQIIDDIKRVVLEIARRYKYREELKKYRTEL